MNYRINTYNKDYIMVNKHTITLELSKLLVSEDEGDLTSEKKAIKKLLIKIWDKLGSYRTEKGTRPIIDEIAISKNSKLGTYLLNYSKENKPASITENHIIHVLLITIEDEEWEHYTILSSIIKNYKQNNIKAIKYNEFEQHYGKELTDFIVTNIYRNSNIDNYANNRNVYLFENNQITKTELPDPAKTNTKTRTKTI